MTVMPSGVHNSRLMLALPNLLDRRRAALVAAGNRLPDPMAPIAVAGSSTSVGVAPATIVFNAYDSADPQSRPLTYDWDFGDGSPVEHGTTASHTYAPGTWTATLTPTAATTGMPRRRACCATTW